MYRMQIILIFIGQAAFGSAVCEELEISGGRLRVARARALEAAAVFGRFLAWLGGGCEESVSFKWRCGWVLGYALGGI